MWGLVGEAGVEETLSEANLAAVGSMEGEALVRMGSYGSYRITQSFF